MIWHCGAYDFDTRMPILMGILNVTPDSFSDGGQFTSLDVAVAHAREMIEQGALIIDVGGESTRPGAATVELDEEIARVLPVVKALADGGMCVSIDTRHAPVAKACVEAGAAIINDVSGFSDPEMRAVAASCDCGCVVMHMRGTPKTMQDDTSYTDLVAEVRDYLADQCAQMEAEGIAHNRICVDPGPGFGKDAKQTLELVRNFHEFRHIGYPVMCAVSRKSFIGAAYNIEVPADRDEASAQEALMACELGATIIRTHNIVATAEALKDVRPFSLIALGCNVPLVANPGEETEGKIAMLNQAISELCMLPDTQIIDIAPFYESEPAYYEDQDTFINTVVLVRTGIAPHELLDYLHAIENSLGRVREIPNGPRTCDLDILDYQLYVCNDEVLTLPHPRINERDFVVKPLEDIVPGHVLADGTQIGTIPESERIGKAHLVKKG